MVPLRPRSGEVFPMSIEVQAVNVRTMIVLIHIISGQAWERDVVSVLSRRDSLVVHPHRLPTLVILLHLVIVTCA